MTLTEAQLIINFNFSSLLAFYEAQGYTVTRYHGCDKTYYVYSGDVLICKTEKMNPDPFVDYM